MKRKCLTILTLVLVASLLLTPVQATLTRYIWDNVHFIDGRDDQHDIKYPHPDRDYYDISRFTGWSIRGTALFHEQMDYDWSQTNGGSVLLVCGAIGTAIGLISGTAEGVAIGIVVGVVLGVIAVITNLQMQDEEGCIWWWTSVASVDWLIENEETLGRMSPFAMYIEIMDNFLTRGYLRLGSTTLFDAIGIGSPSLPQLSISASVGGTTDPAPGTYTYYGGESVTVTATADTHYFFSYWILDGVNCGSELTITVTMDSDHTLYAQFTGGGGGGYPYHPKGDHPQGD